MQASNVIVLGGPLALGGAAAAEGRLQALFADQVPRVLASAAALALGAADARFTAMEGALRSHLDALDALRFDLLVSPGLRAGLLGRDEATFHGQVAAVSECTEASWSAIRRWLARDGAGRGEVQALATDFSMDARTLLRRVAEEERTADILHAHLSARAAQAPVAMRGALDELVARNGRARDVLQRLRQLCDGAAPAHRAAGQLAQSHAQLRSRLQALAGRLQGGLLERLRVLVACGSAAAAGDLQRAQEARDTLRQALLQTLADLVRAQAAAEELQLCLHAVRQAVDGVSGRGSRPTPA